MIYDRERRTAEPGSRGVCPGCGDALIAKCGEIVSWHWAHAHGADCDHWYEPISDWHLAWQNTAPAECREVVMGPHRADIFEDGYVIELQHSALSVAEIKEREAFYEASAPNGLLWLWDARDFKDRLEVRKYHRDGRVDFRWKHPRKSMFACRSRQHWDLGDGWMIQEVSAARGNYVAGMGTGLLRYWSSQQWPDYNFQWAFRPSTRYVHVWPKPDKPRLSLEYTRWLGFHG